MLIDVTLPIFARTTSGKFVEIAEADIQAEIDVTWDGKQVHDWTVEAFAIGGFNITASSDPGIFNRMKEEAYRDRHADYIRRCIEDNAAAWDDVDNRREDRRERMEGL